MKKFLALGVAVLCLSFLPTVPLPDVTSNIGTQPVLVRHCQVPCGIYSDKMRIDMLMEDCATIEKAMTQIRAMDGEENPSKNQMVRWIMTKEQHAQSIQDTVAAYWLAQRIKEAKMPGGREKYIGQLIMMHDITKAAMKCKQTTDTQHVEALRKTALAFSASYFKAEDLKHIQSHHDHKH
jgi:hypothetical protein